MQLTQDTKPRGRRRQKDDSRKSNNKALGRAMRYIGVYPKLTIGAVVALYSSPLASQLAVPQLIQNMIDIITENSANKAIMALPESAQQTLAEELGLDLQGIALSLDNALTALFLGYCNYRRLCHCSRLFQLRPILSLAGTLPKYRLRVTARSIQQNPASQLQLPRQKSHRPTHDPRHR